MSVTNVPAVRSEAEELRTVNSILLETFCQCDKLKSDLLEYSIDPRKDLQEFKEKLVDIAEMQKEVTAFIKTMETIESEVLEREEEEMKLNVETIKDIFNETYVSALDEGYINEEAEKIISAVTEYIGGHSSGEKMDTEELELLVTSTKESYLDPLTKLPIQDPVKSKKCHHTFERSTILKHLQKHTRCPYSGCVNNLIREDLVEDLALKRELLHMRRTQNK